MGRAVAACPAEVTPGALPMTRLKRPVAPLERREVVPGRARHQLWKTFQLIPLQWVLPTTAPRLRLAQGAPGHPLAPGHPSSYLVASTCLRGREPGVTIVRASASAVVCAWWW